MRKQAIIFLLIAAVALPSFASVTPTPLATQTISADAQLAQRVTHAIQEKFGRGAAGIGVEVHDGNVILHGMLAEMMAMQVANRVRRVEGVKSARWVPGLFPRISSTSVYR
jgi:osmotically-inducible protein OsmY